MCLNVQAVVLQPLPVDKSIPTIPVGAEVTFEGERNEGGVRGAARIPSAASAARPAQRVEASHSASSLSRAGHASSRRATARAHSLGGPEAQRMACSVRVRHLPPSQFAASAC